MLLQSESKHAASASCCWRVTLRERSFLLSGEVSSQLNQPAVSLSKLDCLTYVASMLSKEKKKKKAHSTNKLALAETVSAALCNYVETSTFLILQEGPLCFSLK